MSDTFPVHLIVLGLIIILISDELYEFWNSSSCSSLQHF